MQRYHLNPSTGEAGPCKARNSACPFGDETAHHDSLSEARAAYEASQNLPPSLKRDLTRDQIAALASYQGGFYAELNYALRMDEDLDDRPAEILKHLDDVFELSSETGPDRVYRAVYTGKSIGYLDRQLQPGEKFIEYGFLSTSESPEFVEDCVEYGLNDEPVNTILIIETKPEAPCIRPNTHTYNHDNEEEVLFGRETCFEVIEDDRTSSSCRYITLRMV